MKIGKSPEGKWVHVEGKDVIASFDTKEEAIAALPPPPPKPTKPQVVMVPRCQYFRSFPESHPGGPTKNCDACLCRNGKWHTGKELRVMVRNCILEIGHEGECEHYQTEEEAIKDRHEGYIAREIITCKHEGMLHRGNLSVRHKKGWGWDCKLCGQWIPCPK